MVIQSQYLIFMLLLWSPAVWYHALPISVAVQLQKHVPLKVICWMHSDLLAIYFHLLRIHHKTVQAKDLYRFVSYPQENLGTTASTVKNAW